MGSLERLRSKASLRKRVFASVSVQFTETLSSRARARASERASERARDGERGKEREGKREREREREEGREGERRRLTVLRQWRRMLGMSRIGTKTPSINNILARAYG
jgi:hypothetical protein